MTTIPKERNQSISPLTEGIPQDPGSQEKTLVNNSIQENGNYFEVFSHCIVYHKAKVKKSGKANKTRPRGRISHFSKQARFRLFELLAKIDNNLVLKPLFLTLTYHHGHQNSKSSTKSQLHNFLVQLRNFDPYVQFIWRAELQSRGAPHYHLIIFPAKVVGSHDKITYDIKIAQIWHLVADPKSYRHKEFGCKMIVINNYREACSYVSKYVAKEEKNNTESIEGKHWGCSRNLPTRVHKVYQVNDRKAMRIITNIRNWLMLHGKKKYADPEYMHICNDFTVFIDLSELPSLEFESHGEYDKDPFPE